MRAIAMPIWLFWNYFLLLLRFLQRYGTLRFMKNNKGGVRAKYMEDQRGLGGVEQVQGFQQEIPTGIRGLLF